MELSPVQKALAFLVEPPLWFVVVELVTAMGITLYLFFAAMHENGETAKRGHGIALKPGRSLDEMQKGRAG